jgi:hypothetical protein
MNASSSGVTRLAPCAATVRAPMKHHRARSAQRLLICGYASSADMSVVAAIGQLMPGITTQQHSIATLSSSRLVECVLMVLACGTSWKRYYAHDVSMGIGLCHGVRLIGCANEIVGTHRLHSLWFT